MLTRQELSEMLKGVNVVELARRAKLAPRTLYRLRDLKNSPTLDTVNSIVTAVEDMRSGVGVKPGDSTVGLVQGVEKFASAQCGIAKPGSGEAADEGQ